MHPRSHVVLNYTKKTRGCLGHTVFLHVREATEENNNLLTSYSVEEETTAHLRLGYFPSPKNQD